MKTKQVIDALNADSRLRNIQEAGVKIHWKPKEKLALVLGNQTGVEYKLDLEDLEETEIIVDTLTSALCVKSSTEVFAIDIPSFFVMYTKEL